MNWPFNHFTPHNLPPQCLFEEQHKILLKFSVSAKMCMFSPPKLFLRPPTSHQARQRQADRQREHERVRALQPIHQPPMFVSSSRGSEKFQSLVTHKAWLQLDACTVFSSSARAFIFSISPGIVKLGSIPASLIHLPDNSMERQMFETLVLVN